MTKSGNQHSWGRVAPEDANWPELLHAAHPAPNGPSLPLSAREVTVAALLAGGATVEAIALEVGLTTDTVSAYIEQARLKYLNAGRKATDEVTLRARLIEDGHLAG